MVDFRLFLAFSASFTNVLLVFCFNLSLSFHMIFKKNYVNNNTHFIYCYKVAEYNGKNFNTPYKVKILMHFKCINLSSAAESYLLFNMLFISLLIDCLKCFYLFTLCVYIYIFILPIIFALYIFFFILFISICFTLFVVSTYDWFFFLLFSFFQLFFSLFLYFVSSFLLISKRYRDFLFLEKNFKKCNISIFVLHMLFIKEIKINKTVLSRNI